MPRTAAERETVEVQVRTAREREDGTFSPLSGLEPGGLRATALHRKASLGQRLGAVGLKGVLTWPQGNRRLPDLSGGREMRFKVGEVSEGVGHAAVGDETPVELVGRLVPRDMQRDLRGRDCTPARVSARSGVQTDVDRVDRVRKLAGVIAVRVAACVIGGQRGVGLAHRLRVGI